MYQLLFFKSIESGKLMIKSLEKEELFEISHHYPNFVNFSSTSRTSARQKSRDLFLQFFQDAMNLDQQLKIFFKNYSKKILKFY